MAITLDGSTGVTAAEFDGALDASNLTGDIDASQLTGALPAIDGSALTGVGLGNDQTWQDVSGSRTSFTSYQNTTGKTIFWGVAGTGPSTFTLGQVSPDNSSWITIGRLHPNTGTSFSGPVPDGWYYKLNQSTAIQVWAELR